MTRVVPLRLFLISAFLLCFNSSYASTVNPPKTGQTTCYNSAGVVVSCLSTGQDGDWQTGVQAAGARFTVSPLYCITDNLTGLMWERSPSNALIGWQAAIDHAAALDLCGFTDWRIPSIVELESLVNAEVANTVAWLSELAQGFLSLDSSRLYWSGTTVNGNTYAWGVRMGEGKINFGSTGGIYGADYGFVWSVRGGGSAPAYPWQTGQNTSLYSGDDGALKPGVAWPSPRFTKNNNGTVTDNLTGLIWLENADCFGTQTWDNALISANTLKGDNTQCLLDDGSQAGDWRLPNRKEVLSLADFQYSDPPLSNAAGIGKWTPGDPFTNVQSARYWSSTTYANATNEAWYIGFGMWDSLMWDYIKSGSYYVWPVRGGQIPSSSATWSIYGNGTVTSRPAGINCSSISMPCSASFRVNTVVMFTVIPDPESIFSNWGGDISCGNTVTMDTDKSCEAFFELCTNSLVTSLGSGPRDLIIEAYTNAEYYDTIKAVGSTFSETFDFNSPKDITLSGGYDCKFELQTGLTYITGSPLTISDGSVIVDRIVIY